MKPNLFEVIGAVAKKLGHEPNSDELAKELNGVGLINLAENILHPEKENAELKEIRRLAISRAGEKLRYVNGLDDGYSVTIPDPKHERCDQCLSYDHWRFKDCESYGLHDTTFYFECTNIIKDILGDEECTSTLLMKE